MNGLPESREVWEHGNCQFDRLDARRGQFETFIFGVVVGMFLASILWMVF